LGARLAVVTLTLKPPPEPVSEPEELEVESQELLPESVVTVHETGQAQLPVSLKATFWLEVAPATRAKTRLPVLACSEHGWTTERETEKV
jgi:hypothetical protein